MLRPFIGFCGAPLTENGDEVKLNNLLPSIVQQVQDRVYRTLVVRRNGGFMIRRRRVGRRAGWHLPGLNKIEPDDIRFVC